eukprot:scaffold1341_cov178-Amphora_coffeaeformis.AAC.19
MGAFFQHIIWLLATSSYITAQSCRRQVKPAPSSKTVYRIGLLANRGIETSYKEYNATVEYLTKSVGPLFDPPLTFEPAPVPFDDVVIDSLESGDFDFSFSNPSIFTCMASEIGAKAMSTQIAKRNVQGKTYEVTQLGGVIVTLAENQEVKTLADLKDKRIGLMSISGIGRYV